MESPTPAVMAALNTHKGGDIIFVTAATATTATSLSSEEEEKESKMTLLLFWIEAWHDECLSLDFEENRNSKQVFIRATLLPILCLPKLVLAHNMYEIKIRRYCTTIEVNFPWLSKDLSSWQTRLDCHQSLHRRCLPDTGQRSNQGNVGYYSIDYYLDEDLSWTSDGPSRWTSSYTPVSLKILFPCP